MTTVGQDLVAMSVNDILVQGAEGRCSSSITSLAASCTWTPPPLLSRASPAVCELSGCALIGGETAEMPSMYPDGEYDLAGFAVGAVDKSKIIDGSTIRPGDVVLGLASSGAHSNGYSLIRKIIEVSKPDLEADFHGRTLKDVIMEPTRLYVKSLLALMEERDGLVKGLAHITGGRPARQCASRAGRQPDRGPQEGCLDPAAAVPVAAAGWQRGCSGNVPRVQLRHRHGRHRRQGRCCGGSRAAACHRRDGVYELGTIEARAEGQAQTVVV